MEQPTDQRRSYGWPSAVTPGDPADLLANVRSLAECLDALQQGRRRRLLHLVSAATSYRDAAVDNFHPTIQEPQPW